MDEYVPLSSEDQDLLDNSTLETVELFPHKNKIIEADVKDVYDGDTFTIFYVYKGVVLGTKIRLLGVDTPEVSLRGELNNTEIGDLEEKAAIHVKNQVVNLIKDKRLKVKLKKFDKYGGRVIGTLFLPPNTGYDTLTDYLISKKYAKPYKGNKKEPWTQDELNFILQN